jgi:hypothetical protein
MYEKGTPKSIHLSKVLDKFSFYAFALSYTGLLIGIIMSHMD